MSKVPYLTRSSSGTWYFVRRYPQSLKHLFDGPFRKLNLETRERIQAEVACRREAVAFDQEMNALRCPTVRGVCEATHRQSAPLVAADDVSVIAQRAGASYLHTDEEDRAQGLSDAQFEDYVAEVREHHEQVSRDLARGRLQSYLPEVRDIVELEGLMLDDASPVAEQLTRSVVSSLQQAIEQVLLRLSGKFVATPPAAPPPRSEFDLDDLRCAFEHWTTKQSPAIKTRMETKATMERFIRCTGRTRIGAITKDDVLAFQAHERATRRVKPQTINKGINLFSAVVQLACEDKLCLPNPFERLRNLKVRAGMRQTRKEYSPEQLRKLFAGPVHSANVRPQGGAGEAAFWLPVLGYATGARLEELGQLRLSDVLPDGDGFILSIEGKSDEVHALEAGTSGAKSVKNEDSIRLVPVHSAVLAMGFADYVAWVRAHGAKCLFPKLNADHYDHQTGLWSRWYNRYLDRPPVDLDIKGLDFHSFRHLFKTMARDAELHTDVMDALQGHATTRASQGYGRFTTATLRRELERIELPELRAEHLRWAPPTGAERKRLKERNAPRKRHATGGGSPVKRQVRQELEFASAV